MRENAFVRPAAMRFCLAESKALVTKNAKRNKIAYQKLLLCGPETALLSLLPLHGGLFSQVFIYHLTDEILK